MANERGKALDKTHLSIDQAEERGFIHRDYIAHCLRWSHVAKYLQGGKRYESAHILDIGCGKEVPLAKLMYSSRLVPTSGSYLGVDANRLVVPDMFRTGKFPITLVSGIFPGAVDELQSLMDEPLLYDVITCFEVAEHVEPQGTLDILRGMHRYLADGGVGFLSTPCYDSNVGAAANHVNEMSYQGFGSLIEHAGLYIKAVYGTFASMKDYKHKLPDELTPFYAKLHAYYDVNYLATIFAPLFPELSRNCLWSVRKAIKNEAHVYPNIKQLYEPHHSSSASWPEFVKSL